jgi:hypothetical protein
MLYARKNVENTSDRMFASLQELVIEQRLSMRFDLRSRCGVPASRLDKMRSDPYSGFGCNSTAVKNASLSLSTIG